MTEEELAVYVQARPYVRAVPALIFYVADRHSWGDNRLESSFVEADSFLTAFEQRRS